MFQQGGGRLVVTPFAAGPLDFGDGRLAAASLRARRLASLASLPVFRYSLLGRQACALEKIGPGSGPAIPGLINDYPSDFTNRHTTSLSLDYKKTASFQAFLRQNKLKLAG